MKLFANVVPVQKSSIPWGWKNRITPHGIFVTAHPGAIRMPDLLKYFRWDEFVIEEMAVGRDFGTRNMKSVFITASRFLDWEHLLLDQPDLTPITDGYLAWNSRLVDVWDGKLKWFMLGDDIAWEGGLVIRPDWYRSWVMPEHKRLIDAAHSWGMKVIFHSEGNLHAIIDDLADLGVEVLSYQNVGAMQQLDRLREVVAYGMSGRLYKKMFCVKSEEEALQLPLTWSWT